MNILILFIIKRICHIKKNATQSPLYPGTSYDASNAVDRNVGTCMRTEGIGLKSVYHSAWWKVDLGGIYNIYNVNILFKNYEGYGIHLNILLSFYILTFLTFLYYSENNSTFSLFVIYLKITQNIIKCD